MSGSLTSVFSTGFGAPCFSQCWQRQGTVREGRLQGEACLASFSQSCSELILLKKLSRFYLERATWDQKPGLWAGSSRFPPPWASSSMNRASPAGPPPGSHPRAGQAWLQTQPLADPVTGKSYHSSKPVSPSGKAGLWDLGSRTALSSGDTIPSPLLLGPGVSEPTVSSFSLCTSERAGNLVY